MSTVSPNRASQNYEGAMKTWQIFAVLTSAVVAASCGGAVGNGDGTTTSITNPTTPANPNTITLQSSSFLPGSMSVATGTTVTWMWNDCAVGGYGSSAGCVMHNVTFDDGSGLVSPTQDSGTFSRTFTTAGTYKYHCAIHGSAMSGQIVVQ
jgi:plastocyanin